MSRPDALTIDRLSAAQLSDAVSGLAELLLDVVSGGASLGFLASLDRAAAETWWRAAVPVMADGRLLLWIARDADRILGTVSLRLEAKDNGRHRAEVVKLMVHRDARGAGLGRRLLATAESGAADHGATLLLLDTETGSPAEHLYRGAGWTSYGTVPDHAADPGGVLRPTTFFYKLLGTAPTG